MAVRLLCKSRTVLTYKCSLRAVAQSIQSFSSESKWGQGPRERTEDGTTDDTSTTVWPDPNLGFLGPRDRRLPLPGNIGLGTQLQQTKDSFGTQQKASENDLFSFQLPQERHGAVLSQVLGPNQENETQEVEMPTAGDILECIAQECPQLIRKDFADLFPGMDTTNGHFTVVTLSQKTDNDMSAWNYEVEIEREELMLYFVIAAEEICSELKDLGYWADFIDPSSGRPYLGPYTSSTMFETDERYRHLGFRIEDLGCCKVVTHRAWGPYVFVGCLFTNAPSSSSHIKSIIERHGVKKQQTGRKN